MNRRTQASLLALALLAVAVVAMAVLPVPWVIYRPGPTLNVLGEYSGKPILDIKGHPEYRDDGALRLLTIITTGPKEHVDLLTTIGAWIDPHRAVYPRALIYGKADTEKSVRRQSQEEMTSSQDNARAAALREAKIPFQGWVEVSAVDPKGAAKGLLVPGDRLLAVNGVAVDNRTALLREMAKVKPGQQVVVRTRHNGVPTEVTIRTRPSADDPPRALIGVGIAQEFRFPFDIDVNLDERIGGPSAGLMFSVAIFDVLTAGSLTHGKQVAGTGEVDPEGTVGPIGGIQQKIAAAQRDGARLFLVPRDNCAEAVAASYDADRMRLVRADTVDQAIGQIEKWAADPHAELAKCPR